MRLSRGCLASNQGVLEETVHSDLDLISFFITPYIQKGSSQNRGRVEIDRRHRPWNRSIPRDEVNAPQGARCRTSDEDLLDSTDSIVPKLVSEKYEIPSGHIWSEFRFSSSVLIPVQNPSDDIFF